MMRIFFKNEKQDNLDQVVFAQRNKDYGAYALRTEYDQILNRSLMIGIALVATIATLPFAVNAFKSDPVKTPDRSVRRLIVIPTNVIEPPKPVTQATSIKVKTVNTTLPTPSRTVINQKTVPNANEMKGAAIGPETSDGPVTNLPTIPVIPTYPATGPVPSVPEAPTLPAKDPNEILTRVDVSASFKGGINAFRDKVGQNFDTSVIDQSGVIKASVSFVVEKDGSITNVKATGVDNGFNREAERTVKSIKTKWNPAKFNGEIVRSYFNIPITMRIE